MRKDDDLYDEEEGARPSSLIAVHSLSTPDPLYDMQLIRELEIINARTRAELGPLPPGGISAQPKRKPRASSLQEGPSAATDTSEDEAMKLKQLTTISAMCGIAIGSSPALAIEGHAKASVSVASTRETHRDDIAEPTWPSNGVGEREIGDGETTNPENMFVEYANGEWYAWVLVTPEHGQAKALDFFTGEVKDVNVAMPGGYNDSFIDADGVLHKSTVHFAFDYKDPRSGGAIGNIVRVNSSSLSFSGTFRCNPMLSVSQRISGENHETLAWRKLPLYLDTWSGCPDGTWNSLINTGLDLRDGTALITEGKYIFRVRHDDLSPVGSAPHLHVVDEVAVLQLIEDAKVDEIDDINAYITERLHLR